jgi:hypothetical protein
MRPAALYSQRYGHWVRLDKFMCTGPSGTCLYLLETYYLSIHFNCCSCWHDRNHWYTLAYENLQLAAPLCVIDSQDAELNGFTAADRGPGWDLDRVAAESRTVPS